MSKQYQPFFAKIAVGYGVMAVFLYMSGMGLMPLLSVAGALTGLYLFTKGLER